MAGATAVVVPAVMMELEVVRVEENDRSLFAHMAGAVVLVAATVKVAVTVMVDVGQDQGESVDVGTVVVAERGVVVNMDSGRCSRRPRQAPKDQYCHSAQKDWYLRRMCKSSCLRM